MKFLIDHQLPPRLKSFFREKGIESVHVSDLSIETQTDRFIWNYAKTNGMHIVSKDEDFLYLASQDVAGPRLIWVRLGNCSSTVLVEAFGRLWPQIDAWMKNNERIVEIR